jgi:hypothetical protein
MLIRRTWETTPPSSTVCDSEDHYSEDVPGHAAPADTTEDAYAVLTQRWAAMTVAERALLTDQICIDVERLARAGILAQHPDYTEVEICHELARRRYGAALADAAYAGILPQR